MTELANHKNYTECQIIKSILESGKIAVVGDTTVLKLIRENVNITVIKDGNSQATRYLGRFESGYAQLQAAESAPGCWRGSQAPRLLTISGIL